MTPAKTVFASIVALALSGAAQASYETTGISLIDTSTGLEWLQFPLAPTTNNPNNPFTVDPSYGTGWALASLSQWMGLVTGYYGTYPAFGHCGDASCPSDFGLGLATGLGLIPNSNGTLLPVTAWLSDTLTVDPGTGPQPANKTTDIFRTLNFGTQFDYRYDDFTVGLNQPISEPVALVRLVETPEPSSYILLAVGAGLLGLVAVRRTRS